MLSSTSHNRMFPTLLKTYLQIFTVKSVYSTVNATQLHTQQDANINKRYSQHLLFTQNDCETKLEQV
jgi:hypothetical protein